MKQLLVTALLILSLSSSASELETMFEVLKHAESNNNALAIGDNGKAYGVVQIHKICVDDVNRIYGTGYTHQQMFDVTCAKEVFILYLQAGINRYTLRHGKLPTEGQVVRMWNGGIYRGYLKNATKRYLKRYYLFKHYYKQRKGQLA